MFSLLNQVQNTCVNCYWHLSADGGFPGDSDGKESAYSVGDPSLIPGSGRSSGEGNGNPFQYSCLENPMDGGAWWATVHEIAKSWTWLSDFTSSICIIAIIFMLEIVHNKKSRSGTSTDCKAKWYNYFIGQLENI